MKRLEGLKGETSKLETHKLRLSHSGKHAKLTAQGFSEQIMICS